MRIVHIVKSVVMLTVACSLCVLFLQSTVAGRAKQTLIQTFASRSVACEITSADYNIFTNALTFSEWSLTYPNGILHSIHIGPTTLEGFNRFAILTNMFGMSSAPKNITIHRVKAILLRALDKNGSAIASAKSADMSNVSIALGLFSRQGTNPTLSTNVTERIRQMLTTYGLYFSRFALNDVTFGNKQNIFFADNVVLEYRNGIDFSIATAITKARVHTNDRFDLGMPGLLLGYTDDPCADLSIRVTIPDSPLHPILLAASIDAPAIGILSINAGAFIGPSPWDSVVVDPLNYIFLKEATLSLTDHGFGARIAGICKNVFGINPDVFVPQLRSIVWELLPDRSRTLETHDILDTFSRFIEQHGTLALSIIPPKPALLPTLCQSWHEIVTATVIPGPNPLSEPTD